MAQQNYYKANLRDLAFLVFEQFHLDELLGKAPFANWGKDEVLTVFEEAYSWVQKYLGPINASGDEKGCTLDNGQVHVPPGFKEAWKALYDAGWRTLAIEEKHGGQAGPFSLAMLVEELMCGLVHVVQHVPGAHAGRGRRDPLVRHARAAGAVRAEDARWLVGGHDVPDRAAGRQRCRLGGDNRDEASRRQVRHQGHEDLHLRRRSGHDAEHHPHGARAHAGRARRHEGPVAVHRAEMRDRTARRTTSRRPAIEHKMGIKGVGDRSARVRRRRQLRRRARRRHGAKGHVPDVPPDELRAHRRRHSGPRRSRRRRT